ncbi:MAG: hypothetical protein JKX94_12415 [Sneathiella sp.]|nr:hypothetical protein [Sneathiella sp.]
MLEHEDAGMMEQFTVTS